MKYFELHVGDYQRKTAHLTLAEHGAYFQLLMAFYATERPIPSDPRILYRLAHAHSKSERAAVDSVIRQFWYETDQGLTNKRADETLDNYNRWVSQQKANGSLGGRPPKTHGLSNGDAQENPTVPKTKPMGGYRGRARARQILTTTQNDLDTHTTSTPQGASQPAPNGAAEVCVERNGLDSEGWSAEDRARGYRQFDPKHPIFRSADEIEAEERAHGIVPEA